MITPLLLAVTSLLILFVYVRGRVFEPTRIMAGYWSLILLACILLVPRTFEQLSPLWYPAACVATFSLAAFIANPLHNSRAREQQDSRRYRGYPVEYPRALRYAIWGGIIAGAFAAGVALPEDLTTSGTTLADQVASISTQTAVANYAGDLQLGPLVSLSLAVVYAVCLVAPTGFLIARTRWRILYVAVPVASALPYSIVTTQKAVFLYASACVLGSLVSSSIVIHGSAPGLTTKRVVLAAAAVATVVACFVGLSVLRLGSFSQDNARIGAERVRSYLLFPLPAFAAWDAGQSAVDSGLKWGASSVAGFSALSGEDSRGTKAYSDWVVLPEESQATNVYTMFRNTQEDFGRAGQLGLYFGGGWIVGRMYRRAGSGSTKAGVAIAFTYALIFMSVAQLMTLFANVILSFLGAYAFVAHFAAARIRTQAKTQTRAFSAP